MNKIRIAVIGAVIILAIASFSGCITQKLKPCEVSSRDAQGLYEEGDKVTVVGFCEDLATGTEEGILVYLFTDEEPLYAHMPTCQLEVYINRYIDVDSPVSIYVENYYEIEIIYQEYKTNGLSHWRVLNAKELEDE